MKINTKVWDVMVCSPYRVTQVLGGGINHLHPQGNHPHHRHIQCALLKHWNPTTKPWDTPLLKNITPTLSATCYSDLTYVFDFIRSCLTISWLIVRSKIRTSTHSYVLNNIDLRQLWQDQRKASTDGSVSVGITVPTFTTLLFKTSAFRLKIIQGIPWWLSLKVICPY